MTFYIAQAFSFLSAFAIIIGMQCKSMKAILFWQSLGNLAVSLGYFFLGGISGGLIYLFNPLCWMCYDVFTKAIVSFIVHLVVFISTGVGIVRVDLLGKKKAATEAVESGS